MKKKIAVVFVLAGFMVLTGAFLIISNNSDHDGKSKKNVAVNKEEKKSCCSAGMSSEETSDNSFYLLEGNWKSEKNKTINWSSLKGNNYVMSMIFTNCTYACPVIVNNLKKVEAGLSSKDLKKVKFLLVSIDPERDTPEALLKFANRFNLDLNKWQLLTSGESNVSELAAVLGFKYKKEIDGSFSHSNIITVLNKDGEIDYQHFGLNKSIDDVVEAINKLN